MFDTTSGKYIDFFRTKSCNKKTYNINVETKSGLVLGEIKWRAPWRRYVFFPEANTLFDESCLGEIRTYIKLLMEERKKKS